MIELVKSGVAFNEERHTYSLNGKELHGITNMLRRQLFPDEYANVPESTLRRAAERGTAVHQSIAVRQRLYGKCTISRAGIVHQDKG